MIFVVYMILYEKSNGNQNDQKNNSSDNIINMIKEQYKS